MFEICRENGMASADGKMTIGVLTSGGDAPGMNAAIRAVVRSTIFHGSEAVGIYRGYSGLLNREFKRLGARDVSEILFRGGTMLQTARCREFYEKSGPEKGAQILREEGIDALVVIGGDGSYRGARELSHLGIPVIGIPGTIDLDVASTEYSIGFDTAVNTAMEAIDRIKDSSAAHERCSVVEVMGRNAGYLALHCGIACGAEMVLLPELFDGDYEAIIEDIHVNQARGKDHYLIINSEGIGHSASLAKMIEEATGIETRATILGYMQRGGSPTCKDRVTASLMGERAVSLLLEGKSGLVVAERSGAITQVPIDEALEMKKTLPEEMEMFRAAKEFTI